ncbi:MAG: hypothetical protein JNM27_16695 [Leptospirales bacterium]|nr:hypothetical protein [Leptospirales bacterium]
MRVLFLSVAVLAGLSHCVSTDVREQELQNDKRRAREIAEREQLQRRLADEERERNATLKRVVEEKTVREKAEQDQKLREQQQNREEKTRLEIAAGKREEERRREERARLQREKKEREEEERIKDEEAKRARIEAERIEAERKRKEDRERRLSKADPDRRSFFRIDARRFGENIVCRIPSSKSGMVYRNKKALQFHGFAAGADLIRPEVDQGMVLQVGELSSNLLGRKGGFIVILVPDEKSRSLLQEYELLRCDGAPGSAFVIGIESDGEGSVLLELEQAEKGIAGRYFKIAPDSIRIVKD